MKKSLQIILVGFFLTVFGYAPISYAAVTAKVVGVGTYGDGSMYVFFDRAISDCSAASRIDLVSTHPANKATLATAMTAYAMDSNVYIHVGACSGDTPIYTTGGGSYLFLTK